MMNLSYKKKMQNRSIFVEINSHTSTITIKKYMYNMHDKVETIKFNKIVDSI